MKTLDETLELLTKRRVMTLAGAGTGLVPSLASWVAGEPIRGSWWGHPKGGLIFELGEKLADHPDVLVLKLIGDKVTFVHRSLWPALFRIGTDKDHLRRTLMGVSPRAVELYTRVQEAGRLWIEKADKEAAAELEGIVIVSQEHGKKGAHVTVLRSWTDWAPASVRAAAKGYTAKRARSEIAKTCGPGASYLAALPAVQSRKAKPAKAARKPARKAKPKQTKPARRSRR